MTDELIEAGSEAVIELAQSLISTASIVLKRHGNDQNSNAILAAGFVSAINKINMNVDSRFKQVIREMLK